MEFELKAVEVKGKEVVVKDRSGLPDDMDLLADKIVLADEDGIVRRGYELIRLIAKQTGVFPASIYELYRAEASGERSGFTVPSVNFRILTYESAQALFATAKEYSAAAFMLGIARSEIEYTRQSPFEYAAVVLAAAVKSGYRGPVFLQADSLRLNAEEYSRSPQAEIQRLKDLIKDYIEAGFFNIDLDVSSLGACRFPGALAPEEAAAELIEFIHAVKPYGIKIAIGARLEKSEGRNSNAEDLHGFMKRYGRPSSEKEGIIKVAIETGAVHGGIVLPDGSIAKVRIDFDTIKELGGICRRDYNLAGVVQHGASTLPPEAFGKFPENNTLEVHLATQFQNIVYDNLPLGLKERIYNWLGENYSHERQQGQTNSQFIYKTRKKALGHFKKEVHLLPSDIKNNIYNKLKEEFGFLFHQLNLRGSRSWVDKFIKQKEDK